MNDRKDVSAESAFLESAKGHFEIFYQPGKDEVIVDIAATQSAEIDRVAHEAGLTLRMLTPRQDGLEDVFLKMTGQTDAELAAGRRGQRGAAGAS